MQKETLRRRPSVPEWKKAVSDLLKELGLVPGHFTGNLRFEFHEGGISEAKREERIK